MQRLNQLDKEVIACMAFRGWGLYPAGKLRHIATLDAIQTIIEGGRAKNKLSSGWSYVPFPLCRDDTNWILVHKLINKVIEAGRGPFWVEINEKGQATGVYLVDSVV